MGKTVTHEIRLSCYFADAVYEGRKTFELRRNDRGYQTGDRIRFKVVKHGAAGEEMFPEHPICGIEYEITYMLSGWGLNNDIVAMAIRPVDGKAQGETEENEEPGTDPRE